MNGLLCQGKKFRPYPLGMGDLRENFEQINGFSEDFLLLLVLFCFYIKSLAIREAKAQKAFGINQTRN